MARFTCNFISYTLTRTVDATVVIPSATIPESLACIPGALGRHDPAQSPEELAAARAVGLAKALHTKKDAYPVLYLFHGLGNNHATWTGYSNVELYAEERNIAIVNFSAENKSYVNQPDGDRFFDFIEEELPDFVHGMFPVSSRPEDTYIAGLSMGGYGAIVHGLSRPEKYAAVGCFSAALHIKPSSILGGNEGSVDPAYNPHALVKSLGQRGIKPPKIYLSCGEDDMLYDINSAFRKELESVGADTTWVSVPGFGHEWRFWDRQVEAFLDWIPRTDPYPMQPKRVC